MRKDIDWAEANAVVVTNRIRIRWTTIGASSRFRTAPTSAPAAMPAMAPLSSGITSPSVLWSIGSYLRLFFMAAPSLGVKGSERARGESLRALALHGWLRLGGFGLGLLRVGLGGLLQQPGEGRGQDRLARAVEVQGGVDLLQRIERDAALLLAELVDLGHRRRLEHLVALGPERLDGFDLLGDQFVAREVVDRVERVEGADPVPRPLADLLERRRVALRVERAPSRGSRSAVVEVLHRGHGLPDHRGEELRLLGGQVPEVVGHVPRELVRVVDDILDETALL